MKIAPPRIGELTLSALEPADPGDFETDSVHERRRLHDAEIEEQSLAGISLTDCELSSVRFGVGGLGDADLAGARLLDTVLTGVTAASLALQRATLSGVRIVASRVGALELFETKIRSTTLRESKFGLVNLSGSDVRDLLFRECVIDELDLSEANASRIAFDACEIAVVNVHRATLSHVDLRGATIGSIRHLDGLRGTVLSARQAVGLVDSFAAHLDIAIE